MRKRGEQSLINPKMRRKEQLIRGKLVFSILIVIAISLLIVNRQAILTSCGEFLLYQQEPQQADVIAIAANWEDTIMRARGGADLYKQGLAKIIFVPRMERMEGQEELKKTGIKIPENRDLLIAILEGYGVPRDAIETSEQEVTSTRDEAIEVRTFIEQKGYKSVLLVTAKSHSRRAYLIFKDALKGKATVISAPSPYDSFDPELWWKRSKDSKRVIMEYQKLLLYYWHKIF